MFVVIVFVYFVIDAVRKLLETPSYIRITTTLQIHVLQLLSLLVSCFLLATKFVDYFECYRFLLLTLVYRI